MLLQRRDASAPRLSRTAARLPKALDPDNCRAGTDIKLLGRRAPRRPAFNFRKHSRPHVFRIGLRHRPASQNRINADRLSHPSPPENPLDSIGTEHALASEHLPDAAVEVSPSAASPNSALSASAAGEEAPAAEPVLEPQKQRGRPFMPGQSGNPNGRPKGARNRVTRAVEALIDGQGEALGAKAVDK